MGKGEDTKLNTNLGKIQTTGDFEQSSQQSDTDKCPTGVS